MLDVGILDFNAVRTCRYTLPATFLKEHTVSIFRCEDGSTIFPLVSTYKSGRRNSLQDQHQHNQRFFLLAMASDTTPLSITTAITLIDWKCVVLFMSEVGSLNKGVRTTPCGITS
jgi:hypothetical protein